MFCNLIIRKTYFDTEISSPFSVVVVVVAKKSDIVVWYVACKYTEFLRNTERILNFEIKF